jgi:hypothetical protein
MGLGTEGSRAVEQAISVAEGFARGNPVLLSTRYYVDYAHSAHHACSTIVRAYTAFTAGAARAAAKAAEAVARATAVAAVAVAHALDDAGATDAARADALADALDDIRADTVREAAEAARATDTAAAALSDLSKLLKLELGHFPALDDTIDPSESGPLGPLWPSGVPELLKPIRAGEATTKTAEPRPSVPESERLILEAEVSELADTEEVARALADLCYALSAYHIAAGGNGLVVDDWQIRVPKSIPVGTR